MMKQIPLGVHVVLETSLHFCNPERSWQISIKRQSSATENLVHVATMYKKKMYLLSSCVLQ